MGIARLQGATGESVEIRFSTDPYVKGTNFIAIPGGGGARSTKATEIRVTVRVPPTRPLPDRVVVRLHAEPEEGSDREFHLVLEPTGERAFSGQLNHRLVIMTGSEGRTRSREQTVEVVLIRGTSEENLIDPANGTPRFQVNLDLASFAQ